MTLRQAARKRDTIMNRKHLRADAHKLSYPKPTKLGPGSGKGKADEPAKYSGRKSGGSG